MYTHTQQKTFPAKPKEAKRRSSGSSRRARKTPSDPADKSSYHTISSGTLSSNDSTSVEYGSATSKPSDHSGSHNLPATYEVQGYQLKSYYYNATPSNPAYHSAFRAELLTEEARRREMLEYLDRVTAPLAQVHGMDGNYLVQGSGTQFDPDYTAQSDMQFHPTALEVEVETSIQAGPPNGEDATVTQ